MLYTLNIHNVIYQSYLSKGGGKKALVFLHVKMVAVTENARDVYVLQPWGENGPQNLRNF